MSKSQSHYARDNDWPVLELMSNEEKLERVQKLPAPVRGVVVRVPLMLLPFYFQIYEIEPKRWQNPILIVGSVEEN